MPTKERVEPVMRMLAGMTIFCVVSLIFVDKFFHGDDKVFVAISTLLGNASGSFFTRLPASSKPSAKPEEPEPNVPVP